MNRAGLAIALVIAAVVGVVFAVFPRLDLDLAALFFDRKRDIFTGNAQLWMYYLRNAARGPVALLVAPAFIAILGKLVLPRRRMLIDGRAALFLAVTLALGPGIVTNLIFKDHWGRPRPIDVTEFGGSDRFMPWWDPRGPCANNWLVCRRRAIGSVLDVGARGVGAAAMASARLWCGARLWRGDRAPTHRQRRAFFHRRSVRRGVHVSRGVDPARPDLSLARDPAGRQGDRSPARTSRRSTARRALTK
jgi:hypothetical protein